MKTWRWLARTFLCSDYRQTLYRIAPILVLPLNACTHPAKDLYAPPPGINETSGATVTGAVFEKDRPAEFHTCIASIDNSPLVMPNQCGAYRDRPYLFRAGDHKIAVHLWAAHDAPRMEIEAPLMASLQAGQRYTVQAERLSIGKVALWIGDRNGNKVGTIAERFISQIGTAEFEGNSGEQTGSERHSILVIDRFSSAFGDRAQIFREKFRTLAGSCHIATDFLTLPIGGLTLDTGKPQVSAAELDRRAAAIGADGILEVRETGEQSPGGLITPGAAIASGTFSISVLLSEPGRKALPWTARIKQTVTADTGGANLAAALAIRFSDAGFFRQCPALTLP